MCGAPTGGHDDHVPVPNRSRRDRFLGRSGKRSVAVAVPPVAEFAFLSNCHTGSLLAPDGSVDWLSVPRFDSPSVFGSLLDREAGMFRFGPFGINVPSARQYEPGTNVLE